MLQLQRKKDTKDVKEVKHQDRFCCTITCGYCGKCRHYKDECHIKRRESEDHKKAEKENRRPEGRGENPGTSAGKGNLGGEQRSSAPPTGGRGAPNHVPKRKQPRD